MDHLEVAVTGPLPSIRAGLKTMKNKSHILMVRATNIAQSPHICTLANYLNRQGYQITFVCFEGDGKEKPGLEASIEFIPLGFRLGGSSFRKGLKALAAGWKLRKVLGEVEYDLMYILDSWTLPIVWLATGGRLQRQGKSMVYHTFDWLEPSLVRKFHVRLEKKACSRADLVVNTDRARARVQRTLYGLAKTPLWVQNCLSLKTEQPEPREAYRRRMLGGAEGRDKVLLIYPTVVRDETSAQRMFFELIQAVALLPQQYCLATFYGQGREYQRCLGEVERRGIRDRVVFLEPVPFAELLRYVASADLGAILYDDCRSSGYFMCNADKLSLLIGCGIPYVGSDYPNLEAITYRHGLGLCCDPHQPASLAKKIQEIAEGDQSLADRKRHVRKVFENDLHFERHGEKLVQALDSLAG
jgi:glycosyltransferase involved in cell wall biosynthesis